MQKAISPFIKNFFNTLATKVVRYLAITYRLIKKYFMIFFKLLIKILNFVLKYILQHRYYHWLTVEIFFSFLLIIGIIVGNYMPFNLYGINAIMVTFFIGKFISYKAIIKLFSNYRNYQGKKKHIQRINTILKTFSLYEKITLITSGFTFGLFFSLFFRFQERFWETLPFLKLYTIS